MVISYEQYLKDHNVPDSEQLYAAWRNDTLKELAKDHIYFENMRKIDDARIDILLLKIYSKGNNE